MNKDIFNKYIYYILENEKDYILIIIKNYKKFS
jgi:hypothetical protein